MLVTKFELIEPRSN